MVLRTGKQKCPNGSLSFRGLVPSKFTLACPVAVHLVLSRVALDTQWGTFPFACCLFQEIQAGVRLFGVCRMLNCF